MRRVWTYPGFGASVHNGFFIYSEEEQNYERIQNFVGLGISNVFFGIEDAQTIQLNLHRELAQLVHFNWSLDQAYSLPIGLRKFHISEIAERLRKEQEEIDKASGKQTLR